MAGLLFCKKKENPAQSSRGEKDPMKRGLQNRGTWNNMLKNKGADGARIRKSGEGKR
jgi:hypothetical protein